MFLSKVSHNWFIYWSVFFGAIFSFALVQLTWRMVHMGFTHLVSDLVIDVKWFNIGRLFRNFVWMGLLFWVGLVRGVVGRRVWISECGVWAAAATEMVITDEHAPYDPLLEILWVFEACNIIVYLVIGLFHYIIILHDLV